jgi:hypothetical protein
MSEAASRIAILKTDITTLAVDGRWPVHQLRRITLNLEKLCPVHRGLIAMSGRVLQVPLLRPGIAQTPPSHGLLLKNAAVTHSPGDDPLL